jgi:hypothetical protein
MPLSSQPQVIIQSICTTWTKTSRGGTGATRRNSTPDAYTLPDSALHISNAVFLLHTVNYREQNDFQQPGETVEQKERSNPFRYNCLKLSLTEDILDVTLEWERSEGAPKRHAFPRTGFCVQNGQWGRVLYNLRAAWEGNWVYKKHVLNIGLFPRSAPGIFLEGVPVHIYRDMAQLW